VGWVSFQLAGERDFYCWEVLRLSISGCLFSLLGDVGFLRVGYKEKICIFACMEVRDFLRQRVGGELTEAEERILREMGEGKVIDFLGERQVDMRLEAHREAAQAWGSAQRVRAEFLYWLLVWPDFQRLIHPKGLALRGVHVEGKLDFEGAQLLHRLFIEDSYLSGGLSLVEAQARTLSLEGSYLPGLWARRARIEGDLRLESALIDPPQPLEIITERHAKEALFQLEEAVVQGDLDLDAVWMRYPRHIALYAKALRVEGSLYLRRANIEGTVYLVEAQISADLQAQGLSISSVPGGHAFVASPVRIGGETVLDDTEVSAEAALDFRASRLGGNLSLRKVRAKRVELTKVQVQGSLDVSGAHIKRLGASEMILRGDLSMEEGTAELYLRAAQVEGNISLKEVEGEVRAGDLTLKGTLKVERANLGDLNITEARVEGNVELSKVNLEGSIRAERMVLGGDLRLMEVLVRNDLNFGGAQVGGKFEAEDIEGRTMEAWGMQIGKGLEWTRVRAVEVDLRGTRVEERLIVVSLTCYSRWESYEMMVIEEARIRGVNRLHNFSWERGKVSGRLEISDVVTDALSLQGTRVDESLEVREIRVGGAVNLEGFQGGGDILIERCILGGLPFEPGLSLKRAEIAGEVRIKYSSILSGLDAEKLHARSLYVEGTFLTGGEGIGSDSPASQLEGKWAGGLSLKDAQLEDRAYFKDVTIMGPVSLRYAQMQTLEIVVEEGSGKEGEDSGIGLSPLAGWVDLHGISVSRWVFSGPAIKDEDSETRLRLFSAWLRRQLPHYSAHPYENVAKALKAEADENAALRILIQKEDDVGLAQNLPLWKRFLRGLLRYTVGHGYRPEWALVWILAFIALGAFLFELGYRYEVMAPASTDVLVQEKYQKYREIPKDYPPFSAWAYSIDAFIPFLDLVLEHYWIPNADAGLAGALLRIYLWIHIGVGWILSSLFLTSVTGIIRRLE
jgi:cytoskeletal protein CcmA (bactofilin family)